MKAIRFVFLFFTFHFSFFTPALSQNLLNWSSFKWGRDTITVDGKKAIVPKSAIFLPVSFEGDARRYYLQLDLSADVKILLYHLPLSIEKSNIVRNPLTTNDRESFYRVNHTLKGELGTAKFISDSASYMLMRNKNDTTSNYYLPTGNTIIGMIGLDYFMDKKLLIDFPRQQFSLANDATVLPLTFRDSAGYVKIYRSKTGGIMVPVHIGDTTYTDFFYDVGSSIYDLVVSEKMWRKITGRNGDEKDNVHLRVNSWGADTVAIGTPMKPPVSIGRYNFTLPMIFYIPGFKDLKTSFGYDGLFSNSSFYSKTIIIDLPHKKLGIMGEM